MPLRPAEHACMGSDIWCGATRYNRNAYQPSFLHVKVAASKPGRIPVVYLIQGYENNRETITNFYRNARTCINAVTDASMPEIGAGIGWLRNEEFAARQRNVRCRVITSITKDNLAYAKKQAARIDELRHLEGIRANFGISDSEAIAISPTSRSKGERNIQFLYSDSPEVVTFKQMIFDVLWERAAPAKSRIQELEESAARKDLSAQTCRVIDRIYRCIDCNKFFVFSDETTEHTKQTGHSNIREFPIE